MQSSAGPCKDRTTARAWLPAVPRLQALGIRGRRVARRSERRALRAAARAVRLRRRKLALQRDDAGAGLLRGRGTAISPPALQQSCAVPAACAPWRRIVMLRIRSVSPAAEHSAGHLRTRRSDTVLQGRTDMPLAQQVGARRA